MSINPGATNTALVLDADTLPALSIIRSLSRAGVTVVAASSQANAIGRYSRHATQCLQYPDPMLDAADFLRWMEEQLRAKSAPALVIPVTERSLVPLSRHFAGHQDRARFAMADNKALEQVLDKTLTAQLALRCDVPQPRSWSVNSTEELDALAAELPFPLVIKPARSIPDGSTRQQLSVRYAHTLAGLKASARAMLSSTGLILQEYFRGDGIGVEVLARRGDIIYAFQHRRLHEVPLSGGGSSLRQSEAVDPALLDASRRLLGALQWTGVAMVEFKMQPDSGRYILVEINGRFWGSLPLAIAAGADFPRLLWHVQTGTPLPALPPYRRGIRCHKLSAELHWCEAVMRRQADTRLVALPSRWRALRETAAMLLPGRRFDAQSWNDPLPGLVDIYRIAARYGRRLTKGVYDGLAHTLCRFQSRRAVTARRASQARRVLFVCYGNINRSALAEAAARHFSPPAGNGVSFRSAGFHPQGGRAADPRTAALAAAQGMDMGQMRSQVLDDALVEWADLILVMEVAQVKQLQQRFPDAPVLLLGGLLGRHWLAREIADPYNQSEEAYRAAFLQVTGAVEVLGALVCQPTPGAPGQHG